MERFLAAAPAKTDDDDRLPGDCRVEAPDVERKLMAFSGHFLFVCVHIW
jgi:hypothetical protein